jgi:DNA modification methylase
MSKSFYETEISHLFNGDCVQEMEELAKDGIKIDKVITSPPYNIIRPNSTDRGYDIYKDGMSNDEYIDWIIKIFNIYDQMINPNGCVIWNMSYGTENTTCMSLCIAEILRKTKWTLADIIVWKKKSATPNNVSPNKATRICEFVYVFCRQSEFGTFTANKKIVGYRQDSGQAIYENVFNFMTSENNDEPTDLNKATFSTSFVNELIDRYVLPNDVVMDNFSGTGTTMIACEKRNRKGYYIELSEKQCEYSVNRLKRGIQTNLFDFI